MKRVAIYCVAYYAFALVVLLCACAITSASPPVSRYPGQKEDGTFDARTVVRDIEAVANRCVPQQQAPAKPAVQPAVDSLGVEDAGVYMYVGGRYVWCPRGGCPPQQVQPQPVQPLPQFEFEDEPKVEDEVTATVVDSGPSTAFVVSSIVGGLVASAVAAAVGAFVEWKKK